MSDNRANSQINLRCLGLSYVVVLIVSLLAIAVMDLTGLALFILLGGAIVLWLWLAQRCTEGGDTFLGAMARKGMTTSDPEKGSDSAAASEPVAAPAPAPAVKKPEAKPAPRRGTRCPRCGPRRCPCRGTRRSARTGCARRRTRGKTPEQAGISGRGPRGRPG